MKNLIILIVGVYPSILGDLCIKDSIYITEGYRSTSGSMLTLQFTIDKPACGPIGKPCGFFHSFGFQAHPNSLFIALWHIFPVRYSFVLLLNT